MDNLIDFNGSFVEIPKTNDRSNFMDSKANYALYTKQILNSGKVTFNGEGTEFLDAILTQLRSNKKYTARIVRSEELCTFSESDTIYVTTGLIAQITNKEILAFFLAREISKTENNLYIKLDKKDIQSSYDEKIKVLAKSDLATNLKLDKLGYELYLKAGFDGKFVQKAYKILQYSEFPFNELEVSVDYHNSDSYYIPPTYFNIPFQTKQISKDQISLNAEIENRLKALGISDFNETPPDNIQSEELNELVKNARFETTYQKLINGHIDKTLYDIFLLEETYGNSEKLDHWKSYAWFCKSLQKMGVLSKEKYSPIGIDSKSSNYYFFLRRLPTNAVLSITLRNLYDQKIKNPRLEELWEKLILEIKDYSYLDINDFSKTNYYETFGSSKEDKSKSKSDYLDSMQLINKLDSSQFYLYGISDIVSDSSFWTTYNSIEKKKIAPGSSIGVFTGLYKTKGRKTSAPKVNGDLEKLRTYSKKSDSIQNLQGLNTFSYNSQRAIKDAFALQYANSDYNYTLPLIDTSFLSEIDSDVDYVGIALYQHALRPKVRGYHLLGLLVAPLPFVISDFILTMNQSEYCIVIIDTKNGEIVHSENSSYSNPLNKLTMFDRMRSSIYKAQH